MAPIQEIVVSDDDIDYGIITKEVKVSYRGDLVTSQIIHEVVQKAFGRNVKVDAICRRGFSREYSVSFTDENDAEFLRKHDPVLHSGVEFWFADNTTRISHFRVHWLPRRFKNSLLQKVFSNYGEILGIKEDVLSESTIKNGVRVVSMKLTEAKFWEVPHMLTLYSGNIRVLITTTGRLPLCLKCETIGHRGLDCPNKNKPITYADKASGVKRPNLSNQIIENDEEDKTNEDTEHRSIFSPLSEEMNNTLSGSKRMLDLSDNSTDDDENEGNNGDENNVNMDDGETEFRLVKNSKVKRSRDVSLKKQK